MLCKIGNIFPYISNFILNDFLLRFIAEKLLNLSSLAPLSKFSGNKLNKFNLNNNSNKDVY